MAEGTKEEDGGQGLFALLPWDRFSNWLHCVCVVTFDLEIGQTLELVYPGHVRLTEQEKTNICYLAFPDSNSGCMGDTQFHVRIRQSPGRQGLTPDHRVYNSSCPVHLQADPSHFHGYVYFRQIKDKTIPRGYFQKSVVLLSRLPFISLFHKVAHRVANEFFDRGETSIEASCHDVDQWPVPLPGEQVSLPLLGEIIQTQIPCKSSSLMSPGSPSKCVVQAPSPTVLPSVHEINLFRNFCPVLSHVHLLWELVLTAEPIIVMAPSPTVCSEMVYSLVSMIVPLLYCADYRPFFTIHDSEFKEYTANTHAPPSVILGVTNPFFAKTLQNWPHIIRLGETPNLATPQKHKLKKASNLKMLDSKPGVYTYYKSFLQKDKNIIKKLMKGTQTKRPCEVQNAILKRHLLELTQSFMIPLERYMASLMPLQKNISPYKAAPIPKPFNPDDFIATLETSGPQLTTGIKGDWVGLYRKFFRSCNFSAWYNARYREVSQKLQTLQLQALSDADLKLWVQGKKEVEVVDMVLQIRHKIEQSQSEELPLSGVTKQQLQTRLDDIIFTLPEDLRSVLKNC
ncbi:protein DENND6A isoform X2 [Neocloeon triangulifer]|uniref:protein DENND6A isoform X2 n=1 Tax=Neocloeon triangulifer TaxID=2078957 RepID=UPI00286F25C8|nr:protein DENND6A isoform X2 [Neocloeon triangulifer]